MDLEGTEVCDWLIVVPHPANADRHLTLNPEIPVTRDTPPTFLLQAEDDHVDSVYDSLAYYIALDKAGVPRRDAPHPHGRYGFVLRPTNLPSPSGLSWTRSGSGPSV